MLPIGSYQPMRLEERAVPPRPFEQRTRKRRAGVTFGRVTAHAPVTVVAQAPEDGVIFGDRPVFSNSTAAGRFRAHG